MAERIPTSEIVRQAKSLLEEAAPVDRVPQILPKEAENLFSQFLEQELRPTRNGQKGEPVLGHWLRGDDQVQVWIERYAVSHTLTDPDTNTPRSVLIGYDNKLQASWRGSDGKLESSYLEVIEEERGVSLQIRQAIVGDRAQGLKGVFLTPQS